MRQGEIRRRERGHKRFARIGAEGYLTETVLFDTVQQTALSGLSEEPDCGKALRDLQKGPGRRQPDQPCAQSFKKTLGTEPSKDSRPGKRWHAPDEGLHSMHPLRQGQKSHARRLRRKDRSGRILLKSLSQAHFLSAKQVGAFTPRSHPAEKTSPPLHRLPAEYLPAKGEPAPP